MELLRRARNPWGEEVLVGLGWDLFWLAVAAGAVFVVVHAVLAARARRLAVDRDAPAAETPGGAEAGRVPELVVRHGPSARLSHWILAAAVLVLLVTAFVPILGLGFPWVTIHWLAGLVLTVYVLYHVVDTVKRRTLRSIWFERGEVADGLRRLRSFAGQPRSGDADARPAKWAVENKVFHLLTGLAGLAMVATGLLMMFRVDTWLWRANPYVVGMSDRTWGLVYVLHGLAAVGFVGLLMAHVYLAVRPDNLWITRSMIKGWITRDEYVRHHDPARWHVAGRSEATVAEPEAVGVGGGGGAGAGAARGVGGQAEA